MTTITFPIIWIYRTITTITTSSTITFTSINEYVCVRSPALVACSITMLLTAKITSRTIPVFVWLPALVTSSS